MLLLHFFQIYSFQFFNFEHYISGFDEKMSKDLLFDIIKRVEAEGFEVRGIAFDLGNKGLMSQLGFFDGQYFFKNPYDPSRDVCMFPGNHFM